jgi:hypothetical protein
MKRAFIAAAVMAVVSGWFLTTPDLITQVLSIAISFPVIFGILFICLRFIPVANWSLAKQRIFTWLIAAGSGVSFVFMLPLAFRLLTR